MPLGALSPSPLALARRSPLAAPSLSAGVVVLAATNQAALLDRALTRPGRLDRILHVPPPDVGGRRRLLGRLGEKLELDAAVDLDALARSTSGLTGADLANILNLAALRAAADGAAAVSARAVSDARDKVIMGLPRTSIHTSIHTSTHTSGDHGAASHLRRRLRRRAPAEGVP